MPRLVPAALALLLAFVVPGLAARVRLHRPHRGFQMRMGRFTVPPAHEREVCEFRELPNSKATDVQAFEMAQSPGSHHFVIWAYVGDHHDAAAFPHGIVDAPGCTGLGPDFFARANLFGMQIPKGGVAFPPGVAVRIEPHQFVFLNSHYINQSPTKPLVPSIVFNLITAKPGTVKHHAESIILGNYAIEVPPHGTASLTSEWHAPVDLNVIQLSTHQHKRGTGVTIDAMVDGVDAGQLFRNTNWAEPRDYNPPAPIRVKAGDGFRFTCEWKNDDDYPVRFGVTTNDEMCFMTGFYYVDDESQPVPRGPGCLLDRGILCPAKTVASVRSPD